MKTPNLQQTMGLAVILTSAGIVLAALAGPFLGPHYLHLPGVVLCVLAGGYTAYLLGLSGRRRGWTAWLAAGAALLVCVYYVTMPWLVFLVSVLLLACRKAGRILSDPRPRRSAHRVRLLRVSQVIFAPH